MPPLGSSAHTCTHPSRIAGDNPWIEAPQDGALAGPGRAGDQRVSALDAEPPRLRVIPEADGHAAQRDRAGHFRTDDSRQRVAPTQAPARPGPAVP